MSSKINLLICLFIFHLLAATSVSACKIGIYEIKKWDFSVKVTNYGASIISVLIPDKHGMYFIMISLIFQPPGSVVEWMISLTLNYSSQVQTLRMEKQKLGSVFPL